MTWSNGHSSSRIDRIYATEGLNKLIKYEEIFETTISDHKLVIAKINTEEQILKKPRFNLWKLNESVLECEYIDTEIKRMPEKKKRILKRVFTSELN